MQALYLLSLDPLGKRWQTQTPMGFGRAVLQPMQ